MSILLLEGFDDNLWTIRTGGSLVAGGVSGSYGLHGNGVRLGNTTTYNLTVGTPTVTKFTIGFALKVVDSDNTIIVKFGTVVKLEYDSASSRLKLGYQDSSFTWHYYYTTNGSVGVGDWHYVEIEILSVQSSSGTLQWWLDGTQIDDETGLTYQTAVDGSANFGGSGTIDDFYIDDLYVVDATGGVNDSALGPIEVEVLLPSGNGNSSVMVGSDGNSTDNYLLVDNNATAPPATTEYVESDTEGDKDTYAMDDLDTTGTVKGMVVSMYAIKTDTGAKYLRPIVRTSSTDYAGDSKGLAESYSLHEHVWDENPNTASAWTYGEINGMEVGQEVRDS